MSQDALPKGYTPENIEQKWRTRWETEKTFTPDMESSGEAYSIVIPPPNVTGSLHMGHALNLTLQDVLCRHARQKGKKVLWVPGTDHAGIATQNVVERALAKEGKTRHDLGREAFIERIWEWRKEYGDRILSQIRAIGASVDWTRERFTMDEGLSRAVRQVFVTLYEEDLIYKGDYIINWCNRCHTALADDEVEHAPQAGKLWKIRYPLADKSGFITIATTRPETMLGDTAVCVHPEDTRYTHLIGKLIQIPLTERQVPIIADSYVDKDFGTGALKVTPSHDYNDWELGHKHKLEFIQVLNDQGLMNENGGAYVGLEKEVARVKVLEDLEKLGLLESTEDYSNSVGVCYRCKSVVEPHVSTQWFIATKTLAAAARKAVSGETQIFPETWTKTYYHWLDNIRDWCISRQIWWGHRIPAWTCDECGKLLVRMEAPSQCECGCTQLQQDEDVLDTWFSSALWPFSTLGWPDDTQELRTFYPVSVLVTGFDILFFWVARMMMMGIHFKGEVPFPHVYLHALVRDASGKKMSKSIGNVIDPLVMIETYGTDALRFTLTAFAAMGRDIRLSEERIEGYRHFVNKIWNAARFSLMHFPESAQELQAIDLATVQGDHHAWILHRLETVKAATDAAVLEYRFNDVAQGLYRFIWNEFCDWYLEFIKLDMQAEGERKTVACAVLWTVLRESLLLLHPIMPFVTAEIWSALPGHGAGSGKEDIAVQLFPELRPQCCKPAAAERMEMVQAVISAVRTIRAELNISPSLKLTVYIQAADAAAQEILATQQQVIMLLARLEKLELHQHIEADDASATQVAAGNTIIVPLRGIVDFAAELQRLEKEAAKLEKELKMLQGKLANAGYLAKAAAEIVEKDRARAQELVEAKQTLLGLQARFKKL